MTERDLQPAFTLWPWYKPEDAPHAFRARTPREATEWQAQTDQASNVGR